MLYFTAAVASTFFVFLRIEAVFQSLSFCGTFLYGLCAAVRLVLVPWASFFMVLHSWMSYPTPCILTLMSRKTDFVLRFHLRALMCTHQYWEFCPWAKLLTLPFHSLGHDPVSIYYYIFGWSLYRCKLHWTGSWSKNVLPVMIFTELHGALSKLFHSHNQTLTSCRAQGKPDFIFLIIHRQMLKKEAQILCQTVCPSIIGLVAKSLSVIEVWVPPFYFSMPPPFHSPFYFRSSFFSSSSCFPGLCRDIHHGGLRLLLNFTVFPLCSNVLTLVFAL